jgi:hypothetical protein
MTRSWNRPLDADDWDGAVEAVVRAATELAWKHIANARAAGYTPRTAGFDVRVGLIDSEGNDIVLPTSAEAQA